MDFGFNLPSLASDASAGNAANTQANNDFGFDDPLPMEPQQSWTNAAPPTGSEDFGMDVPLMPEAPLRSTGIGAAPLCNVPTGCLSDLDARGCLSGSTTTKCVTS
jgi:hypothetical protein